MPVVMKFGGTSVEDAAAIERVAAIVNDRRAESPVVITSAMAKVTDRLVELATLALSRQTSFVARMVEALRERHLVALRELTGVAAVKAGGGLPAVADFHADTLVEQGEQEINALCDSLSELLRGIAAVGELTPRSRDAVLAFGERLSPILVRAALVRAGMPAVHIDARRVVITDEQFTGAQPIYPDIQRRTDEEIRPALAGGCVPVLGGFIGATRQGIATTLGRGGSDFSAAILGAVLNSERVEIWTDVEGMLTVDPRVCDGARRIKVISFAEAAELAYFGAKVLHPATLLPAMQKNIPVWVLNSKRWFPGPPDGERTGTLVTTRAPHCSTPFKSISCKRRIAVIDIVSTRMLMAHGFLKAIFDVFAQHLCPVDMVSTSEVSVSLTVSEIERVPAIADELGRFADVRYEGRKAIVCLVGESIRTTPGIAAQVFDALGNINVRMISQGASEINIGVVIDDDDVPEALQRLHQRFFSTVDAAIFA
jgi:aspartate kinase